MEQFVDDGTGHRLHAVSLAFIQATKHHQGPFHLTPRYRLCARAKSLHNGSSLLRACTGREAVRDAKGEERHDRALVSLAEAWERSGGTRQSVISTSCEAMKVDSGQKAFSMKPYEWRPMPSMLTPNHDTLVTTLPNTAIAISPRSRT